MLSAHYKHGYSVLDQYTQDLNLEYHGVFERPFLEALWSISAIRFHKHTNSFSHSKKQLIILVELCQNVALYSKDGLGILSISPQKEQNIKIETKNIVSIEQKEALLRHLTLLKNSVPVALEEIHKQKLEEKSSKKSAGIGLVEVYKYSKKVQFKFVENKNSCTFHLTVII